jgi:hypothetical protein
MNLLFPFSKCLSDWLSVIICVLVYDQNWKLSLLAMLNTGKCIMWHLKSLIYSFCVYFVRCHPSLPSKTPKLLLLRYMTYPCLSNLKVADLCMDELYLIEGNSQLEHFFSSVERDVLLVVDLHWHNMSLVMYLWCWCAVDAFGRVQSTTVFPESHYVEENAWCLHFECTRTL